MGGNATKSSEEENGVENGIDAFEEDVMEAFGDKLIFLRNAMIQLHGQFLHFKHVQKFRNRNIGEDGLIAEEVKMMNVLIMVIYKGIEELKADKEIPTDISTALNNRIEEMSDVVARLMLEFDEFKANGSMFTIEELMSHLNPFDVPTVENLREEEAATMMPSMFNLQTEENEKQLEKLRRRRIQSEEECEVQVDNSRILHGQRRIQAILRHRVVLFINTLNDLKTHEVMGLLNKNQVEYTVFDVSTDPEIRFIAKDLADCEVFPQVFIDCEFRNLEDFNFDLLPKLFN